MSFAPTNRLKGILLPPLQQKLRPTDDPLSSVSLFRPCCSPRVTRNYNVSRLLSFQTVSGPPCQPGEGVPFEQPVFCQLPAMFALRLFLRELRCPPSNFTRSRMFGSTRSRGHPPHAYTDSPRLPSKRPYNPLGMATRRCTYRAPRRIR